MKIADKELPLTFPVEFITFLFNCYEKDYSKKNLEEQVVIEKVTAVIKSILTTFENVYSIGGVKIFINVYGEWNEGQHSTVEIFNENTEHVNISNEAYKVLSDFGRYMADVCYPKKGLGIGGGGLRAGAIINEKELTFEYSVYTNIIAEKELSNRIFSPK